MDIDVAINALKDTSPSNFEEHNAVHSKRESDHGVIWPKKKQQCGQMQIGHRFSKIIIV